MELNVKRENILLHENYETFSKNTVVFWKISDRKEVQGSCKWRIRWLSDAEKEDDSWFGAITL